MFGFGSPRKRKKMSSRQLWFSVFFFFFNVMSWWFVFSIAIAIPASFEGVGDLVCFVFVLISVGFVLFYLHCGGWGVDMEVRGQLVRIWSSLSVMWIPGMELLTC